MLVLALAAAILAGACSLFVPDDRELAPPGDAPRGRVAPLQPPQVIAEAQSGVYGVAIDAQNVYWTVELEGTIRSAPKTGEGPITAVSVSAADRPTELISDGVRLYWADGPAMRTAEPSGKNNAEAFSTVQSGSPRLTRLWLGPVSFVITDSYGGVWQRPRDGGRAVDLGRWSARAAVDGGSSFFWITASSLMRFTMPEGPEVELAQGEAGPQDLAIDGESVYWLTSSGEVKKIPRDGALGDATTLAAGQANPTRMALDDTHVYFTNAGDGAVRRVPKGGGPVEDIATGQGEPFAIVVDTSGVYWTNRSGGAVMVARR